MSSLLKRVSDKIEENDLNVWLDCCNTIYGSFIASVNLLKGADGFDDLELLRRLKKAELPNVDDPDFMRKTAEAVGFDYEKDVVGKPLMFSYSQFNTIVTPYLLSEGEVVPIPIRRDAILQRTVSKALINETYKLVDWSSK